MPLDQALIGSVVTGVLALLSQAVSKCKCHIACERDESGELCEPRCQCGFLDASLLEMNEAHILDKSKDESAGSKD